MSESISRMEIMCEDKLVMPIKRILASMRGVYEVKDQPVINARAANGKVTARVPNGNTLGLLADYLRKHKLKNVQAQDIKNFQTSIGRSEGGYSGALKTALDEGLLKKSKTSSKNNKYASYDVRLPRL